MPRPRFDALPAERRSQILKAAAAELSGQGFGAASTNRIIERAGVSKGALYYYFDGRDDLLLTTLRDAVERAIRQIGAPAPFDDALGFWDSLEELYARIMEFVLAEPELAGLVKLALTQPPQSEVETALATYISQVRHDLEALLERGRAVGAVRTDLPVDLLARVLVGAGDASDRWSLEHWDELSPKELDRTPHLLLELSVRIAAPLELVIERERRAS